MTDDPQQQQEQQSTRFVVKRCDGSLIPDADPLQCFWITREFFDEAVEYIQMKME